MRKVKNTNIITIEEAVSINQEDKKIILEAGDRIEILHEDYSIKDIIDKVNEIDLSELLKEINRQSIPIKKLVINDVRDIRGSVTIDCDGDPIFKGKDLGIFVGTIKQAQVTNFNSAVSSKNGELIWWSTWVLEYIHYSGGSNSSQFLISWYNFETKKWVFKADAGI